ncbi:MAG: DNA/RNA non-specific endonuclease [Xanthobacteraceae bacterium]
MATQQKQLARLRRYNLSVRGNDPKLAEEVRDLGYEVRAAEEALSPQAADEMLGLESIAMRTQRPVLAIRDSVTQLVFIDEADSKIWGERLTKAKPLLDIAIPSVGRIDLTGAPLDWVGTGWLVAENIIVTNRHVAREFAERKGDGFAFKVGLTEPMSGQLDFVQEIDNPERLVFKLVRPLHIEEPPGPDVSFFEIEMVSGDARLANPIELASTISAPEQLATLQVATIGYPAYDSRIPEPDLMERIYGKVYNKKRLAPGGVTRLDEALLWHNCTTLGGNSGSVVFDLNSGRALGLHFSGSFLVTNYAVRADVVKKLLNDVRTGRTMRRTETAPRAQRLVVRPGRPSIARPTRGGSASLTIPLTVNISMGFDAASRGTPVRYPMPTVKTGEPAEFIAETEAVASSYRDRRGYDPAFLGQRAVVDLPTVDQNADDILDFEVDGATETELRYEHFSVVMSRGRRMCFLSACNIDGNQSRKSARVAWKWDPRIPKAQQIMHECYGSPPKFSRGHMTRREDPGWGSPAIGKRGNEDSMHVTNTTPQMQAFNAPIWLALEDYALQHAREDEMKISVFTGPYFTDDDPEMYGVRIPLIFWKVIAFIHDQTGKLCATGYEMNQENTLQPEEEFVFGSFTSPQLGIATQVPIRLIEERSGIKFGNLASVDPLANDQESMGGGFRSPLLALEQVMFLR